jgi:hypothetical protein
MIHELLDKDMHVEDKSDTPLNEPIPNVMPEPVVHEVAQNAGSSETDTNKTDTTTDRAEDDIDIEQSQLASEQPAEPQVKLKVPPEGLKITETEREYIKRISPLIGSTPRTIKRFINIYRLIRAHQDLSRIDEKEEYLIVIFILTMHLGIYKEKADSLFFAIREHRSINLDDILKLFTDDESKNVYLTLMDEKLKDLLAVKAVSIQKYISFIRRFSFNALEEQIPLIQMRDSKDKDLN